jgi:pimeloyl-ACP methyl ester carboxylesterase
MRDSSPGRAPSPNRFAAIALSAFTAMPVQRRSAVRVDRKPEPPPPRAHAKMRVKGVQIMKFLRRLFIGAFAFLVCAWIGLVVYAYWPTGVEERPARELAGPDDKFVSVDGLELRYREYGEAGPDRPTLVLIHGFGNSLQSFRLLAPLLADDYHVFAVDMPGFGLSSKPADWDYRNPNQARVMGNFIRALGLDKVIVGGHSLGGSIALRVAVNEPEVSGLVLMNPGIINSGVPAITQYLFFPMGRLMAKQMGQRDFRETMIKGSFINPDVITDDVLDSLQLTTQSEGYMQGMTTMMGQYDAPDEESLLAEANIPTVIVWGELDKNKTPEELAQLETGLPNERTLKVPGVGHYVHEEGPEAVAAGLIELKPFLASS